MAKIPTPPKPAPSTPARPGPAAAKHEAVIPEVHGRPMHLQGASKVKGGPAFYLCWHPEQWVVLAGNHIVPRLRPLRGTHGANGVVIIGGRPSFDEAIKQYASEGWTVIPFDFNGGYLQKTPLGGYVSRWEQLVPGSDRTVPDEEGYAKWCGELVTLGLIPPPADYVLGLLLEDIRSQVTLWRSKNVFSYSARADEVEPRLKALTEYRERLFGQTATEAPIVDTSPDVA